MISRRRFFGTVGRLAACVLVLGFGKLAPRVHVVLPTAGFYYGIMEILSVGICLCPNFFLCHGHPLMLIYSYVRIRTKRPYEMCFFGQSLQRMIL